ncbi:hypothetical protein [Aeromonas phage Riv-10]|uniref:Uncharacterized protein n=3 Tax=Biquartavirus TaxID=1912143 RepID=Q6U9M3_9CAUD|nr:hypothetical protein ST44RRORF079c [Aeromonas phage 44RR2.8t]APU00550.1 hypothetical protein [Aeromonas phage 44RR2.8t.2]APU01882.1 hypothetical protein [Aeromonas phage L9-6]APU02132.1 hypothetical protein [Aeromonas phage Riv-10]UYD59640.1 hypothetical protein JNMOADIG_00111 [Aeromonas phage avDM5]UYD60386.1 hypothetical protein NPHMPGLK_00051 [Aeromonas phage avDM2]
MKITKATNLQSIDFAKRQSAKEIANKPVTRIDAITGTFATTMIGVGAAMCAVGETAMAIKTFGATIVFSLVVIAITRGLNK